LISKVDMWTMATPYNVVDKMGLPFVPKSLFRHHMQQFEYIANVTRTKASCELNDIHREGLYI
jgi:hypothetical protein